MKRIFLIIFLNVLYFSSYSQLTHRVKIEKCEYFPYDEKGNRLDTVFTYPISFNVEIHKDSVITEIDNIKKIYKFFKKNTVTNPEIVESFLSIDLNDKCFTFVTFFSPDYDDNIIYLFLENTKGEYLYIGNKY